MTREQEYRWYVTGCERLGQTPMPPDAFETCWQEFEDHAGRLQAAEADRTLARLDAEHRAEMEDRIKDDPFVKAVLVGMAETQS